MKNAPVTVIIPCFNCATTLERAVNSVHAQTVPPAEIFLVNDASADNTAHIIERLRRRYGENWISVIELDRNSGPATARNVAWEKAKQPYVAFLDADDAWHPQKLEIQYEWMRKHPEVALCGHATTLARSAEDCMGPPRSPMARRITGRQLLVSNRFPTRSVMLRRDLLFRFHSGKDYAEDYLLWLEILLSGHQGWHLESTLAFCFKPDFSEGGYSGDLWLQERRGLNTLRLIWRQGLISRPVFFLAAALSLIKYFRRQLVRWNLPLRRDL